MTPDVFGWFCFDFSETVPALGFFVVDDSGALVRQIVLTAARFGRRGNALQPVPESKAIPSPFEATIAHSKALVH